MKEFREICDLVNHVSQIPVRYFTQDRKMIFSCPRLKREEDFLQTDTDLVALMILLSLLVILLLNRMGYSSEADEGEFLSLLGPSGCGKSTMLRIICGLESYQPGDTVYVSVRPSSLICYGREE